MLLSVDSVSIFFHLFKVLLFNWLDFLVHNQVICENIKFNHFSNFVLSYSAMCKLCSFIHQNRIRFVANVL